jgi:hypothetical protein
LTTVQTRAAGHDRDFVVEAEPVENTHRARFSGHRLSGAWRRRR